MSDSKWTNELKLDKPTVYESGMYCPYCETRLEYVAEMADMQTGIEYLVFECECEDYVIGVQYFGEPDDASNGDIVAWYHEDKSED